MGPFYMFNTHSSKQLTIKDKLCTEGTNVELNGIDLLDQQWVLNSDNTIESVGCPGMVLDIDGSTCKNGLSIIISTKTSGSVSQRWSLREDGSIESLKCENRGIDIRGYGTHNGAHIHLWSIHGEWNQIWEIRTISARPSSSPSVSISPSVSFPPTEAVSDVSFLTVSPSFYLNSCSQSLFVFGIHLPPAILHFQCSFEYATNNQGWSLWKQK